MGSAMPSAPRFAGLACLALTSLACSDPSSPEASTGSSSGASESSSTANPSTTDAPPSSTSADVTGSSESSAAATTVTDPSTSSTTDEGESTAGHTSCEDLGSTLPLVVVGTTATGLDDATVVGQGCQLAWGDASDATYVWSAPEAGWYSFSASSPSSQSGVPISLFDGCGGAPLQCAWRNGFDEFSTLAAELEAGESVMIAVDSMFANNEAPFTLHIDPFVECGPAVDLGSQLVTGLQANLAGQGDEVWGGCGYDAAMSIADVTYSWTAPETGIFTASATAAGFAGSITVYRGHCGSPSDRAACKLTTGSDGGVAVSFPAEAGETLTLVVDGFAETTSTAYTLDIVAVTPLVGDCCAPHDTTGCEDFDAVACACGISADCCNPEIGWPEACAGIAGGLCGACPPEPAGDCCDVHDTYGCSNELVSACACQITGGSCCGEEVFFAETWSEWCVLQADQYCNIDCP